MSNKWKHNRNKINKSFARYKWNVQEGGNWTVRENLWQVQAGTQTMFAPLPPHVRKPHTFLELQWMANETTGNLYSTTPRQPFAFTDEPTSHSSSPKPHNHGKATTAKLFHASHLVSPHSNPTRQAPLHNFNPSNKLLPLRTFVLETPQVWIFHVNIQPSTDQEKLTTSPR